MDLTAFTVIFFLVAVNQPSTSSERNGTQFSHSAEAPVIDHSIGGPVSPTTIKLGDDITGVEGVIFSSGTTRQKSWPPPI